MRAKIKWAQCQPNALSSVFISVKTLPWITIADLIISILKAFKSHVNCLTSFTFIKARILALIESVEFQCERQIKKALRKQECKAAFVRKVRKNDGRGLKRSV
jgi:hypothetical protein